VVFAFSFAGLVWPSYSSVTLPLYVVCFALSLFALFYRFRNPNNACYFLRPFIGFCYTIVSLGILLFIFTLVDHHDKCDNLKDLYQRHLSASYGISCEFVMVFWIIAEVICLLLTLGLGLYAHSLYKTLLSDPTLNQQLLLPNNANQDTEATNLVKHGSVFLIFIMVGIIGGIFVYDSFLISAGEIPGVCPVGEGFLTHPRRNDLGCCTWLNSPNAGGTCCSQVACKMKNSFSELGDSACNDALGLLSCSVCNVNSANFATGFGPSQINICTSFCNELYSKCTTSYHNALDYCTNTLKVNVSDVNCFNSSSSLFANPILIGVLISILILFNFQ